MTYDVLMLQSPDELSNCPIFRIDQFNWGGSYRPVTTGRLAFVEESAFILEMECLETNPCRTYQHNNDPVYLDSAMEAFFCFAPNEPKPCYLNFEINANGAMLACYGRERQNRTPLPENLCGKLSCRAQIHKESWSVHLVLPVELIQNIYPDTRLNAGSFFTCNFYKIKESEGQTHFASFAPIPTPEPNFHLPEYFASAHILAPA